MCLSVKLCADGMRVMLCGVAPISVLGDAWTASVLIVVARVAWCELSYALRALNFVQTLFTGCRLPLKSISKSSKICGEAQKCRSRHPTSTTTMLLHSRPPTQTPTTMLHLRQPLPTPTRSRLLLPAPAPAPTYTH